MPDSTEAAREPSVPAAFIVGCGYLGSTTAHRLAAQGRKVFATTRSERRWDSLRGEVTGVARFAIDETRAKLRVPSGLGAGPVDVFVMLTPSAIAPALAAGAGFDQALDTIAGMALRRAVLVSSTGVYANALGAMVTAETPVDGAADERRARLIEIEQRWSRGGPRFSVCRLAGIYGPGRIIGRGALLAGERIAGDADAWLNLIHVEDAAALLIRCAAGDAAAEVELGSDGHPVRRGEYYGFLADLLGAPPPVFDPTLRARSDSKRCDPGSTRKRLDWEPVYRDYRSGLRAAVAADAA